MSFSKDLKILTGIVFGGSLVALVYNLSHLHQAGISFLIAMMFLLVAGALHSFLLRQPNRLKWITMASLTIFAVTLISALSKFFDFLSCTAVLAVTSLFLLNAALWFNLRKNFAAYFGLCLSVWVGWIGLLSLLSYAFDINTDIAWKLPQKLDAVTSLGLALLGFAVPLAIFSLYYKLDKGFKMSFVAAWGLISSVAVITQILVQADLSNAKNFFEFKARSMAEEIFTQFKMRNQDFLRMARRWEVTTNHNEREWLHDAAAYYQDVKGIQSIQWIDTRNIIRWVHPIEGNEILKNRDLNQRPKAMQYILSAKQGDGVYITPPTDIAVGGYGFAVLYPLFNKTTHAYQGMIGVSYKFQNMFPNILQDKDFHLEIYEGSSLLYKQNDKESIVHPQWKFTQEIKIFNRYWRLVIAPTPHVFEKQSSWIPMVVFGFGFLISVLLGFTVLIYYKASDAKKETSIAWEWLKAVTESSHVMIISSDEHGIIKSFNRAAEDILGYKAEEVVGKVSGLMWHEEKDYDELLAYMAKADQGVIESREWAFITKKGQRLLMTLTISTVRNEDNQVIGYVGIAEDLTEKKMQEAKLIASSRMASLGEMAAGIAHEINNPLTIIVAHAAHLRKTVQMGKGIDESMALERLQKIESTVQRIARIIRGLKFFAREGDPNERQKVDVTALIDETLTFCSERFRHAGVEMNSQIQPGLMFHGQALQISQIILNLLNNAFDAVQTSAEKKVFLDVRSVHGGVEFSVKDTGPGIPEDLREKIMQPFFTTKDVGEGLGLGLSISQGIAKAHQGKLYLDPQSRQTRFVLWIPSV